jgi:hypothetical protein
MLGLNAYSLGYDAGRSDEQTGNRRREIVHQILSGERPVTVDQSYIDRLHAALADASRASDHNLAASNQFHAEALKWKDKAHQFRTEALFATLRGENAVLLARLIERNPDLAEEQAAHDETFKEKQSLQRFRVLAASLIDALLAGRADRPEFAELLTIAKDAADTIERGDLFTAFRDEPEKNDRLCSLADALQKP